jgi:hypothetical protein
MNLGQQIAEQQRRNEQKLAHEVATPRAELDTEAALYLRHFAEFCSTRGVLALPCRPATAAAYVRAQHASHVPADRILAALNAVEAVHSNGNFANPVATPAVRTELERILKIEPPSRWSRSEQLVWAGLPVEAKEIITRHSELDHKAVRKAMHEASELRHKVKSFEQEGNTNAT